MQIFFFSPLLCSTLSCLLRFKWFAFFWFVCSYVHTPSIDTMEEKKRDKIFANMRPKTFMDISIESHRRCVYACAIASMSKSSNEYIYKKREELNKKFANSHAQTQMNISNTRIHTGQMILSTVKCVLLCEYDGERYARGNTTRVP